LQVLEQTVNVEPGILLILDTQATIDSIPFLQKFLA